MKIISSFISLFILISATSNAQLYTYQGEFAGESKGLIKLSSNIQDIAIDTLNQKYILDDKRVVVIKDDSTIIKYFGGSSNPYFANVKGIAVDKNLFLYVCDQIANMIHVFSPTGNFIRSIGTTGQLKTPSDVEVDDSLKVYVADNGNNRVAVFKNDGSSVRYFGGLGSTDGKFQSIVNIGLNKSGDIYALDQTLGKVQVFTNAGVFVRNIGSIGTALGQFSSPTKMCVAPGGQCWISDGSRVQGFMKDGVFMAHISGSGNLSNPRGLVLDKNGKLFVGDNFSVKIFASSSIFLSNITPSDIHVNGNYVYVADVTQNKVFVYNLSGGLLNTISGFNYPTGLNTDLAGNLYVADKNNHCIKEYSANGINLLQQHCAYGVGDGEFNFPVGAVAYNNSIYVLDQGNGRLQKFDNSFNYQSQRAVNGNDIAINTGSGDKFIADKTGNKIIIINASEVMTTLGSLGNTAGKFNAPTKVDNYRTGSYTYVAVTDSGNHRIQILDRNSSAFYLALGGKGTALSDLSSPSGASQFGTLANNVLVADPGNKRILKMEVGDIANSSKRISAIGTDGSSNGSFMSPRSIKKDKKGNFYIPDGRKNNVQVFTTKGEFIRSFGNSGTGDGQFDIPSDLAIDNFGNIIVVDLGNNRIQMFTNQGVFIRKWGTLGTANNQFNFPTYVAVDGQNNIYISDKQNNRVQVFNNNGVFVKTLATSGTGAGQVSGPREILIDEKGDIYIHNTSKISVFDKSGAFLRNMAVTDSYFGFASDTLGNLYAGSNKGKGVSVLSKKTGTQILLIKSKGTTSDYLDVTNAIWSSLAGDTIITKDGTNNRFYQYKYKAPSYQTISSFNSFNTDLNQASFSQTYTLKGNSIGTAFNVKAPQEFQLSLDGTTFSDSLSISPIGDSLSQTIYVRMKANTNLGTFNGDIQHTLPLSTQQNIAINGVRIIVTGLEDILLDPSSVIFPNPASNTISIQTKAELETVTIMNAAGTVVGKSQSKHLDISALSEGIYFLMLKEVNNSVVRVVQMVKE